MATAWQHNTKTTAYSTTVASQAADVSFACRLFAPSFANNLDFGIQATFSTNVSPCSSYVGMLHSDSFLQPVGLSNGSTCWATVTMMVTMMVAD